MTVRAEHFKLLPAEHHMALAVGEKRLKLVIFAFCVALALPEKTANFCIIEIGRFQQLGRGEKA